MKKPWGEMDSTLIRDETLDEVPFPIYDEEKGAPSGHQWNIKKCLHRFLQEEEVAKMPSEKIKALIKEHSNEASISQSWSSRCADPSRERSGRLKRGMVSA